jgi:hypothetical protein
MAASAGSGVMANVEARMARPAAVAKATGFIYLKRTGSGCNVVLLFSSKEFSSSLLFCRLGVVAGFGFAKNNDGFFEGIIIEDDGDDRESNAVGGTKAIISGTIMAIRAMRTTVMRFAVVGFIVGSNNRTKVTSLYMASCFERKPRKRNRFASRCIDAIPQHVAPDTRQIKVWLMRNWDCSRDENKVPRESWER